MNPPRADRTLEALLTFVKETRGFDFTGYKRSTIQRRVAKRMSAVGAERSEDYLDHLELHGEEFAELFDTLLINTSGFFRDPQTWEYVADEVVPQLLSTRGPENSIRVWCAGCASGEEPYTVAMVLSRVMGDAAFRGRVKIYATDVDEAALDYARHGAYLPRQIEDVPQDALEHFFERTDQRYVFRKDLRRCVVFGRDDLVQDASISRIDMLGCRNTLMYFTAETQAHILRRFHFGLDDDGYLLLGKSEMLIAHTDLFAPVELKRRAFRKVIKPTRRDRVRVMANNTARRMFSLGRNDFGRPLRDLELSYRPVELRSHLDTLDRELRSIKLKAVHWQGSEGDRFVDVRLLPLLADGASMGTSITYLDVTDTHRLEEQLAGSKRELEQAYVELQSTVEELDAPAEGLLDNPPELLLQRILKEQPCLAQSLVFPQRHQIALSDGQAVLEDHHQRVLVGEVGACLGRPAAERLLVEAHHRVGDLEHRAPIRDRRPRQMILIDAFGDVVFLHSHVNRSCICRPAISAPSNFALPWQSASPPAEAFRMGVNLDGGDTVLANTGSVEM